MNSFTQRYIHDSKKEITSVGLTNPLHNNEYPSNSFIYPKSIINNEEVTICVLDDKYFVQGSEQFVIFESEKTNIQWIESIHSFYKHVEINSY